MLAEQSDVAITGEFAQGESAAAFLADNETDLLLLGVRFTTNDSAKRLPERGNTCLRKAVTATGS